MHVCICVKVQSPINMLCIIQFFIIIFEDYMLFLPATTSAVPQSLHVTYSFAGPVQGCSEAATASQPKNEK